MRIEHQQVELFRSLLVMNGGNEHAAGVDAHHRARRQVRYSYAGLADELLGLVILMDAGENHAVCARAVIESELEKLFGLLDCLAVKHLDGAEIGLGEGIKIDEIGKQRLDLDLREVDLLLSLNSRRGGRLFGLFIHIQRLHCGDGKDISVIGLLKWYSLYYPK